MKATHIGIKVACTVLLVAFAISCTSLALGGDKKYKVELTNFMVNIENKIDNDGEVSDRMMAKFESFMEASKELYYEKGSYVRAERGLILLRTARSGSDTAFMDMQNAKDEFRECKEMLKTEVQD